MWFSIVAFGRASFPVLAGDCKPVGSRFKLDMDVKFRQKCGVPSLLVGVVSYRGRLAVTFLLKVSAWPEQKSQAWVWFFILPVGCQTCQDTTTASS